jgi:zinc and cadmium transporter
MINTDLLNILGLAAIGSIAGLLGGIIFLAKDSWARVLCKYAVPFAAGVLLTVSLIHLIPEAVDSLGNNALLVVLIAFLASFFFEQFFAGLHHHDHDHGGKSRNSIPLIIVGDTIHNFIDGVAIAAAYLTDPRFGLIVAFASFLHETPHEIADFGILVSSGWKKTKTFYVNLLSAMATFPGALWVYFTFEKGGGHEQLGALLAVAAGVFLYLGATDFLPEVGEEVKERGKKFALLLAGVLVMVLLKFLTPEV